MNERENKERNRKKNYDYFSKPINEIKHYNMQYYRIYSYLRNI